MSEVVKSPQKLSTKKKVSSLIKKIRRASESKDKVKDALSVDVQDTENLEQKVFSEETPAEVTEQLGKTLKNVADLALDNDKQDATKEDKKSPKSPTKNGSMLLKSAGKMVVKTALKSATGSDEAGELICGALESVSENGIKPESIKSPTKKQAKKQALAAAGIVGKIAIKSAKVALDMDDPKTGSGEGDETADKVANMIGTVVGKSAKAGLGPLLAPVAAVVEVGSTVASASKK